MHEPPRRDEAEASAILRTELERIERLHSALGEAGAHVVAGWALVHAFEWEAGALAWARARELEPDDPEPHYQEGICLLELGRWDDAAARFHSCMEADARRVAAGGDGVEWMEDDPAYRLGVVRHAQGDLRGALEWYEESARRNGVGTDALREAARCRLALGEVPEALDALSRLERRAVRLTLRAEIMTLRSDAARILRERGS